MPRRLCRIATDLTADHSLGSSEPDKVRFRNATTNCSFQTLSSPYAACRENTMPIYKAPVEDVTFLLNDVFQIDRYDNLPGFTDASADVREAILGEAAKLSEEVLQPLNRVGDLEGCKRARRRQRDHAEGLQGRLQAGRRRRLARPVGAGGIWRAGPAGDADARSSTNSRCSANMAFSMYGGLTHGRDRGAAGARHARAEDRCSCRRWWPANGPAP